jgi:hypothetical protein
VTHLHSGHFEGMFSTLVWTSNSHSLFASDEGETDFRTGRFVYVWHSNSLSPDDTLLETRPYAQMDWSNCGDNTYGIETPGGSATPDVICKGNLTMSEHLEPGVSCPLARPRAFHLGFTGPQLRLGVVLG